MKNIKNYLFDNMKYIKYLNIDFDDWDIPKRDFNINDYVTPIRKKKKLGLRVWESCYWGLLPPCKNSSFFYLYHQINKIKVLDMDDKYFKSNFILPFGNNAFFKISDFKKIN